MTPWSDDVGTGRGWFGHALIVLCCGLWVGTWIRTLAQLGAIQHPFQYDLSLLLVMGVQLLPIPWVRTSATLLVGAASIYAISTAALPNKVSLAGWRTTIQHALLSLLTQHAPSPVLAALVFALIFPALFGLVLYSSHYRGLWLFYQALALFAMTAVGAAARIPVIGAIAILLGVAGLGLFAQMHEKLGLFKSIRWRTAMLNTLPALALIGVLIGLAAWLPKPQLAWNPWLNVVRRQLTSLNRSASHALNPARFNRVGFQPGPQTLGGGIQTSAIPVLSLVADGPTYLRGQVMASYTGHTWQPSADEQAAPIRSGIITPIGQAATFHSLPYATIQQQIQILGGGLHTRVLFGSYRVTSVSSAGQSFSIASVDSSSDTWSADRPLADGQRYTVISQVPVSPYPVMGRQRQPFTPEMARQLAKLLPAYVEVPRNFPQRDTRLAQTITRSGTTEYQKVQLLVQYLKSHERYSTQNIPVPGRTQDYVDQFVFSTHRGYCNNFSTALAVLLRSVGIPTRWVTGFNVGVADQTYSGPLHRYVVRDSDAHSWIEVYFSEVGWIPFDATPGFQLPFGSTVGDRSGSGSGGTGGTSLPPTNPGQPGQSPKNPPHRHPTPPAKVHPQKSASPAPKHQGVVSLPNRTAVWLGICIGLLLAGGALLVARRRSLFKGHARRRRSNTWQGISSGLPGRNERSVNALVTDMVETLRLRAQLPIGATLRQVLSHGGSREFGVNEKKLFIELVERLWYSAEALTTDDERTLKEIMVRWKNLG